MEILGYGPLTKKFLLVRNGNEIYLVYSHNGKYRFDDIEHEKDLDEEKFKSFSV